MVAAEARRRGGGGGAVGVGYLNRRPPTLVPLLLPALRAQQNLSARHRWGPGAPSHTQSRAAALLPRDNLAMESSRCIVRCCISLDRMLCRSPSNSHR